jgi:hypothetical protein
MTEFSNNTEVRELRYLISKSLEGSLSREEVSRMEALLESSVHMRVYYREYVSLYCDLKSLLEVQLPEFYEDDIAEDRLFWETMARHENLAPPLELNPLRVEHQPELIQKVERPKIERQFSKFSLVSLITSIAAIIFLVVFGRFAPIRSGIEVATLIDTLDAKWSETSGTMKSGTRLTTGSTPWSLREGYIQLRFDNDARVVIEGPAAFNLLTGDQLMLRYGRAYAVVPKQAYGFTICTPNSRIIDLGTEFGVQSDIAGDVKLHVIKGQAQLVSNIKGSRINKVVNQNSAQWLSAQTGDIQDIPIDSKLFVRQINSGNKIVWRGESRIDLADLVGGGNGFGTGVRGSCLDPETGDWLADSGIRRWGTVRINGWAGNASYHAVPSSSFIDGVFVPNGQDGPQVISSEGHQFVQVPATSGRYWGGIINVDGPVLGQDLVLDNRVYGTAQRPALFMHTNAGITFDLAAIRELFVECELTEFSAVYGVQKRQSNPFADFWVLVDGQVKFQQEGVQSGQSGVIRVPLSKTARYLTLAVTESKDRLPAEGRLVTFDTWCVFGLPSLKVQ